MAQRLSPYPHFMIVKSRLFTTFDDLSVSRNLFSNLEMRLFGASSTKGLIHFKTTKSIPAADPKDPAVPRPDWDHLFKYIGLHGVDGKYDIKKEGDKPDLRNGFPQYERKEDTAAPPAAGSPSGSS